MIQCPHHIARPGKPTARSPCIAGVARAQLREQHEPVHVGRLRSSRIRADVGLLDEHSVVRDASSASSTVASASVPEVGHAAPRGSAMIVDDKIFIGRPVADRCKLAGAFSDQMKPLAVPKCTSVPGPKQRGQCVANVVWQYFR